MPTVTDSVRLPRILLLAWHSTDVSDFHVDRSHAVYPTCNEVVKLEPAILLPKIVMLADPLVIMFDLINKLIDGSSLEKVSVFEPGRIPAVAKSFLVPSIPLATLHFIDVPDIHVVLSQAVKASRILSQYVVKPKFAPINVKLAEPVAALFCWRTPLKAGTS